MTAAVKKIIRSMDEHPEDWSRATFTLKHQRSGLEVWTGMGFSFYGIYRRSPEANIQFNFVDRIRMSFALARWKRTQEREMTLDDCAALLDQVEAL
jgi:hypothetical protein